MWLPEWLVYAAVYSLIAAAVAIVWLLARGRRGS